MSFRRLLFTVALAIPLASGCALHSHALGPVVPDRPGYTDTPVVLPAGALQTEAGYTDDRASGVVYRSYGESLVRVGLGSVFELRLFGNSYGVRNEPTAGTTAGMEDLKAGVKVLMIEQPDSVHSVIPSLALLLQSTVPTGATGIGAGVALPEAHLAAAWTTASPFMFGANAGYGATYDGVAKGTHAWVSEATWYALNPRVSLYAEGIATRAVHGAGAPADYVDGGITFLVNDRLQLDLRAGRGVSTAVASERYVGVGIARRW